MNDPGAPPPPVTRGRLASRLVGLALVLLGSLGSIYRVSGQSQTPGGMPPPPGMSLAASAAMRFPQPVRVGALLHRDVQEPVESQRLIGHVERIVRSSDGTLEVVMTYGGFLGVGARLIAVPVDAMVLVGQVMEVVAYTPKQLANFPTFVPGAAAPLAEDSIIKVGLAKPSH